MENSSHSIFKVPLRKFQRIRFGKPKPKFGTFKICREIQIRRIWKHSYVRDTIPTFHRCPKLLYFLSKMFLKGIAKEENKRIILLIQAFPSV